MAAADPLVPTAAEERLKDAAKTGTALDLGGEQDTAVRAQFVRELVLGRQMPLADIDPGGVGLRNAKIVGGLDLRLVNTRVALDFDRCSFDSGVDVSDGHLSRLYLRECTVDSPGPCLNANATTIDCDLILTGTYASSSDVGTIVLFGTRVSGDIDLRASSVTNTGAGPAVYGDRADVDGSMGMAGKFESAAVNGTIVFGSLHVAGQLQIAGVEITCTGAGPAMQAERMTVDDSLSIDGTFRAQSDSSAINLNESRLSGRLMTTGTLIVTNTGAGSAFGASGISIAQPMTMAGAQLSATTGLATLAMSAAHLHDTLDLGGAAITNDGAGPVVDLSRAAVDGELALTASLVRGSAGICLDLTDTSTTTLTFDTGQLGPQKLLSMDGLTYRGKPNRGGLELTTLVDMLSKLTDRYAAQPYQFLAAAFDADGDLADRRVILVAQQKDRIKRVLTPAIKAAPFPWRRANIWGRRFGLVLSGSVVDYGYRPWKAAWYLLGVIIAAIVLSVLASHESSGRPHEFVAQRAADSNHPAQACSSAEQIGLGLSIAIPLINNVTQGDCNLTTSTEVSGIFAGVAVGLQTLSWATLTLVVAGYTSIIRQS